MTDLPCVDYSLAWLLQKSNRQELNKKIQKSQDTFAIALPIMSESDSDEGVIISETTTKFERTNEKRHNDAWELRGAGASVSPGKAAPRQRIRLVTRGTEEVVKKRIVRILPTSSKGRGDGQGQNQLENSNRGHPKNEDATGSTVRNDDSKTDDDDDANECVNEISGLAITPPQQDEDSEVPDIDQLLKDSPKKKKKKKKTNLAKDKPTSKNDTNRDHAEEGETEKAAEEETSDVDTEEEVEEEEIEESIEADDEFVEVGEESASEEVEPEILPEGESSKYPEAPAALDKLPKPIPTETAKAKDEPSMYRRVSRQSAPFRPGQVPGAEKRRENETKKGMVKKHAVVKTTKIYED